MSNSIRTGIVTGAGLLIVCGLSLRAQDMPAEGAIAAKPADACRLAADTVIDIEILEPISSSTAVRGNRFRIALAEPLLSEGLEVLPAGATGEGQIVHADRSRGGGKPGELLLAARHIDHGAGRLALRGMKMGGRGDDRIQLALGTSFAIGPFAHFIRGKEIEIPANTRAHARLADDAWLPCTSTVTATQDDVASDLPADPVPPPAYGGSPTPIPTPTTEA